MRFWVSWVQPTGDHRPLNYPPEGLLGWWCSGYDADDHATLVALLDAKSEEDAREVIAKHWPESTTAKWRFCDTREDSYVPGTRFPLPDWSPLSPPSGAREK
jgi:hypothetical protein